MVGEAIQQGCGHLGVTEHCKLPLISNGSYLALPLPILITRCLASSSNCCRSGAGEARLMLPWPCRMVGGG